MALTFNPETLNAFNNTLKDTLNKPPLNEFNVSLNTLQDNLNDVIQKKSVKPSIKKLIDIYEQSTQASTADGETYNTPEFNSELIDDLTNEEHIIYNKKFKQETYLNQPLFYINYTHNNKVIALNVYGYKPDNYKFIDKLGNLYIASNKPFYLIGCEPFKQEYFYKLMYIIYYDENDQTQTEY